MRLPMFHTVERALQARERLRVTAAHAQDRRLRALATHPRTDRSEMLARTFGRRAEDLRAMAQVADRMLRQLGRADG